MKKHRKQAPGQQFWLTYKNKPGSLAVLILRDPGSSHHSGSFILADHIYTGKRRGTS